MLLLTKDHLARRLTTTSSSICIPNSAIFQNYERRKSIDGNLQSVDSLGNNKGPTKDVVKRRSDSEVFA